MVSNPNKSPRLVVIEGKDKGKIILLKEGTAVIGRSKADVLIEDPRISRSHLAIHFDGKSGQLTFNDLKSLNGTFINGVTKEEGRLCDGDRIQIGNTLFDCQIGMINKPEDAAKDSSPPQASHEKPGLVTPGIDADLDAPLLPQDVSPAEENETNQPSTDNEPDAETAKAPPTNLFKKIPRNTSVLVLVTCIIVSGFYLLFIGENANEQIAKAVTDIKKMESDGKIDEAIGVAEKLRTNYPDNMEANLILGELYEKQSRDALAVTVYQKAHAMNMNNPIIHPRLARSYLRMRLDQEAMQELSHIEQLIRDGKHSRELFIETAKLFLEFKNFKHSSEKVLILSKALQTEYAPTSTIGYKLEAQLHLQENRAADALAVLEKAKEMDPNDEWTLEYLVLVKLKLNNFAAGELSLRDWMRSYPNSTKPLLVMAYLKYNEKNYSVALPFVEKLLSIGSMSHNDPHYSEALHLMGLLQLQFNQSVEAANYLNRACQNGFRDSCDILASRSQPKETATNPAVPAQNPLQNNGALSKGNPRVSPQPGSQTNPVSPSPNEKRLPGSSTPPNPTKKTSGLPSYTTQAGSSQEVSPPPYSDPPSEEDIGTSDGDVGEPPPVD